MLVTKLGKTQNWCVCHHPTNGVTRWLMILQFKDVFAFNHSPPARVYSSSGDVCEDYRADLCLFSLVTSWAFNRKVLIEVLLSCPFLCSVGKENCSIQSAKHSIWNISSPSIKSCFSDLFPSRPCAAVGLFCNWKEGKNTHWKIVWPQWLYFGSLNLDQDKRRSIVCFILDHLEFKLGFIFKEERCKYDNTGTDR